MGEASPTKIANEAQKKEDMLADNFPEFVRGRVVLRAKASKDRMFRESTCVAGMECEKSIDARQSEPANDLSNGFPSWKHSCSSFFHTSNGTNIDPSFGAFCLHVRTLTLCQLMGFPLNH